MTPSLKNKLPIWGWLLIIGVILLVGVVIAFHFTGRIDLVAIGGEAYIWITYSPLNTIITLSATAVISLAIGYGVTKYFIGIKTAGIQNPNYIPQGQTVGQQQPAKEETVIST